MNKAQGCAIFHNNPEYSKMATKRNRPKPHEILYQILNATGDEILTIARDIDQARRITKGTGLVIQYPMVEIRAALPCLPPPSQH